MKWLAGLRVLMAVFVAVLTPLRLGHCVLMTWPASGAAMVSEQHPEHADEHDADEHHAVVRHDDGDRVCCPESTPSPASSSGSDAACCGSVQIPSATTPAPVSWSVPASDPLPFIMAAIVVPADAARGAARRFLCVSHSGSPPEPSTAAQSPRSPPHSA